MQNGFAGCIPCTKPCCASGLPGLGKSGSSVNMMTLCPPQEAKMFPFCGFSYVEVNNPVTVSSVRKVSSVASA